jgi:hypothetical protein
MWCLNISILFISLSEVLETGSSSLFKEKEALTKKFYDHS